VATARQVRAAAHSALCLVALSVSPVGSAAQVPTEDLVTKEALVATIPPDSLYDESRELVGAPTGQMSAMRARVAAGEVRGGVVETRDIFIALHARPSTGPGAYDRGVAAVRVDSLYRVLYVAEIDPGLGYVESLETLAPPGARGTGDVSLLHVRYAQTGSGGVTEDLLFALDADDQLLAVPIEEPELTGALGQGESLCCSSFTSFDHDLIELTVYVTRGGRSDISDRIKVRYGLTGQYRLDAATKQYVPDFKLAVQDVSSRESAR
jgi:hypothetical protein